MTGRSIRPDIPVVPLDWMLETFDFGSVFTTTVPKASTWNEPHDGASPGRIAVADRGVAAWCGQGVVFFRAPEGTTSGEPVNYVVIGRT